MAIIPKIYQLKITLKYSSPPIWRRIQVPGNLDIIDLHDIIQVFMGWDNDHLFSFLVGGVRYEDSEEISGPNIKDVSKTSISTAFTRKGAKGIYTYDFGDTWEHEVLVEGIIDPEPGIKYPICLEGKCSCPPEDCGGVGGYYQLLDILKDHTHEAYNEMVEWIGDDIDPDKFDCEEVNKRMPSRRVLVKIGNGNANP